MSLYTTIDLHLLNHKYSLGSSCTVTRKMTSTAAPAYALPFTGHDVGGAPCAELQAAWADIGSGGRACAAEVVELEPEERADRLLVELHDGRGTLAAGSVPISTLWEARPCCC